MDLYQMWIIIAITWLAVISPGADFAIISRNSSIYGRSAGLATSVGVALGCWVHVAYAMFGLALLTRLLPNLFGYIQFIGAGYLIYIGVTTALCKTTHEDPTKKHSLTGWHHYSRGFLTNSLNPKTSLFVISLYSQVIGVTTPLLTQFLWGLFISLSHFIWFGFVSVFMSSDYVRRIVLQHQRVFNVIIGAILIGFGVTLFLNNDLG